MFDSFTDKPSMQRQLNEERGSSAKAWKDAEEFKTPPEGLDGSKRYAIDTHNIDKLSSCNPFDLQA